MITNAEPEMEFANEMAKKHGCKEGAAFSLYLDYKRHFRPIIERTDTDVLTAKFDEIRAQLVDLEDGMRVELAAVMRQAGLDPTNRSDAAKTRLFLNESELLQHNAASPERWVRRITNANGDPAAPDAAAE